VVENSQTAGTVEAPRGFHSARVDDKGRLKLPVPFQQYLSSFPENKLFVTKLRDDVGRIYPIPIWRKNEEILFNSDEDAEEAEDIAFLANRMGSDSEMDGQGRVLLPPLLRRKLGIENQPVQVMVIRGVILIYSESVFEQIDSAASAGYEDKLRRLQRKGFK
jgi:MraZ protein